MYSVCLFFFEVWGTTRNGIKKTNKHNATANQGAIKLWHSKPEFRSRHTQGNDLTGVLFTRDVSRQTNAFTLGEKKIRCFAHCRLEVVVFQGLLKGGKEQSGAYTWLEV